MGLFSDELLLNIQYLGFSKDKPNIIVKKSKSKIPYILDFGAISLILSQLTVLSNVYASILADRLINFVQEPNIDYRTHPENTVSGFELNIYKKNSDYIYNQFYPTLVKNFSTNNMIESDMITIFRNYVLWTFKQSGAKNILIQNLLLVVNFYATQLRPEIIKHGNSNIQTRKSLAGSQVALTSKIFQLWQTASVIVGTEEFSNIIHETRATLE